MARDNEHPPNARNKVSLATAKAVPVFLVLVVIYTSYVVVGPLSIDYLINSPAGVHPRVAAGIAIPIVWLFLLLPVTATYLRLLLVVFREPGYVPLGDEKTTNRHEPPPDFWVKDVFVCDRNGVPIWCQYCQNWKPDRAHHNQDVGRCTLKMDHFCPWVGGVVGERSIKFFLQFLTYSMVLSAYLTILLAYFVHESRSDVQWMVALGLGGFFLLFTLGMVINSMHLAAQNVTTVEQARSGDPTYLAVLLPPEMQIDGHDRPPTAHLTSSRFNGDTNSQLPAGPFDSEIDELDPSHSTYFSNQGSNWPLRRAARSDFWRGTVTYPLTLPTDRPPIPAHVPRTFALLEAPSGLNLWNLGSPWRNLSSIFGTRLHQWLLPLRHAPEQASGISFYPLGPEFEQLLEDAGLVQPRPREKGSTVSSRKRRRRLDYGWQNGERPDGWFSQEEARRMRKKAQRRMREERGDLVL